MIDIMKTKPNPFVEPKGICLKHRLSKGHLPLYKGHRVTESVLIGIFRVVQLA